MANINTNFGGERQMIFGSPIDAKKAILLTFIAFLFTGFQCAIYGMLTVPISNHFGINSSIIISWDGLGLFGQILAMATGGFIIRAIRGKNLLILAAILMIVGSIVSIYAPTIYFYTSMTFLCNMAVGYVLIACNYMTMGAVEKEGQSEGTLSILNMFFSLGFTISAAVVGAIIFHMSWQAIFIIIMIMFVIFIIFLLALRIDELAEVGIEAKIAQKLNKANEPKEGFINLRLVITAVALFFIVYVEQLMNYFNQPHLQQDLGFNIEVVGFLLTTYGFSQMIGRLFIGKFVLPRVSVHKYIISAAILFAIMMLVFLKGGHNEVFIFIIIAVLGLCDSCIYPSVVGYGMDQLKRVTSAGTSFIITIGAIGIPLGNIISGQIGAHFGRPAALMLGPIFLIILAILVFIVSKMKNTKTIA